MDAQLAASAATSAWAATARKMTTDFEDRVSTLMREASRQRDYIEDLRSDSARISTEKENAIASWTKAQYVTRRTLAEKTREQAVAEERDKVMTANHAKELRALRGQAQHHMEVVHKVETPARETTARQYAEGVAFVNEKEQGRAGASRLQAPVCAAFRG